LGLIGIWMVMGERDAQVVGKLRAAAEIPLEFRGPSRRWPALTIPLARFPPSAATWFRLGRSMSRADHHMTLGSSRIELSRGPKVHHTRPAADPLFISAAEFFGSRVLGLVLSGGDGDGAEGLRIIKERGGTALVQDPKEAETPAMPRSAIVADHPDDCLPTGQIAERTRLFCSSIAKRF
jgi:hypothetical protein